MKCGENNPMWKGGRTIASNGYVLIRVGTEHPLADVRGYAYEHRLVASQMIGRLLEPQEQVHHKNGNKQDNREENLEVVPSIVEHRALHRSPSSQLRQAGESNPEVSCKCGCGRQFTKYDSSGRPREYLAGHNAEQLSPTVDSILAALTHSSCSINDLHQTTGIGIKAIKTCLSKLKRCGIVINPERGMWTIHGVPTCQ